MTQAPDPDSSRRGEPPPYTFEPVATRALNELGDGRQRHKLVAIVAPMGYGKTVLMAALHARLVARGERCYWTTLDERDLHAQDVLQQLERHSSRYGSVLHPTQALFRGDESLDTRIESLIRIASERQGGFTAFIDNLHFCSDPRLGPLLDRLVFETPDDARFVFSSTAALPLHLARAKLDGRVRQIGYADLSLDLAGVADLLGPHISAALGHEHLEAVLNQTEGWPAALRMMQLALAGSREPRALLQQFSGSDEDLVALLNRQVLQGLPDTLRDFLLSIAPLHSFDAALCAQVTGDTEAQVQAHLDWLVQHNVFMVPLDRSRSRYRLHGLFRQYLQAEARQRPDAAARGREALQRAAQWCEQQGRFRDAVDYALAAQALPLAVRILDRAAPGFVRNRGDLPQYLAWARALLDQGATLGWEAEYWYIWGLALNQRYDEARHQLERFARRIRRSRGAGKAAAAREVERRLDIVRMCIAVFTDALDDADRQAAEWLDHAAAEDPFDMTVARCIRSIHASSVYRFVDARAAAVAAQSSASQTRSDYAQGWLVALTHLPTILEGHYDKAYPALLAALESLPERLGDNAGICGTIALLAANCAVEMGDDEAAQALIAQGLRTAHSHGFIDAVACGLDAALKLWPGAPVDTALPQHLQQIVGHYPPRLAFLLGCQRIRRLLRLNRLAEAQAEALSMGLDPEQPTKLPAWALGPRAHDEVLATLIDLQVSAGRGKAVAALLAEQLARARAEGRVARQVDLGLMQALSELGDKRPAPAARHLTRAITLAAPRRIVRPFRDLAPALAALVEDTKPSAWGFATADERRLFADLCARLPLRDAGLQDRLVRHNVELPLPEPLTDRQAELLLLLEAGLGNQQIADRLDLTLSTVKGHLQRLYGKLGASSRAAALARARVLKLL